MWEARADDPNKVVTEQPHSTCEPPELIETSPPVQPVQPMPLQPMGPVRGCPAGLEYLIATKDLLVQQEADVRDLLPTELNMGGMRIEMPNQYNIINSLGQRIYFAGEEGVRGRGMGRPFTIIVYDFAGRPVLKLDRPFDRQYGQCTSSCNCTGRSGGLVSVTLADGSVLGTVTQQRNGTQPLFHVSDGESAVLATVLGPRGSDCCCSGACSSKSTGVDFAVLTPEGQPAGKITKQWGGYTAERLTNADTFGVNFTVDLDVRVKALLLGAVFLIDFTFFEKAPSKPKIYGSRDSAARERLYANGR